jgi:thymidylate synthase ThyX
MGKKSRRDRGTKEKKMKDEPARIKAVEDAKKKIESLGLSPEVEGIKTFYDKCDEYIKTGEHYSGKIELNGFKRILEYILPQTYQTDIGLVLKYDKNI